MTSYVKDSAGPSVPMRLDPMSKTRMAWIKAQFPTVQPSNSMTIRRALSCYVRHLEAALLDPEQIDHETTALKACASGDPSPWGNPPDFTQYPGKSLPSWVKETHLHRIDNMLNSSPFAGMAYRNGFAG